MSDNEKVERLQELEEILYIDIEEYRKTCISLELEFERGLDDIVEQVIEDTTTEAEDD